MRGGILTTEIPHRDERFESHTRIIFKSSSLFILLGSSSSSRQVQLMHSPLTVLPLDVPCHHSGPKASRVGLALPSPPTQGERYLVHLTNYS
ncbi:hypothetical protein FKM82_024762 [Ascaphus truei]